MSSRVRKAPVNYGYEGGGLSGAATAGDGAGTRARGELSDVPINQYLGRALHLFLNMRRDLDLISNTRACPPLLPDEHMKCALDRVGALLSHYTHLAGTLSGASSSAAQPHSYHILRTAYDQLQSDFPTKMVPLTTRKEAAAVLGTRARNLLELLLHMELCVPMMSYGAVTLPAQLTPANTLSIHNFRE